jgi:hypothetical protein
VLAPRHRRVNRRRRRRGLIEPVPEALRRRLFSYRHGFHAGNHADVLKRNCW